MVAKIVVITGASSGIGKATALAFARRGARLALCARDAAALDRTASECQAEGAEVIVYAADVVDPQATESLCSRAASEFGSVDVWINCAAILSFGRFTDISPEAFGRVIETNVLGYANGARAALLQFRSQGDRGTLINVGSVLGLVGEPYVSAYVASKFAIRGLTACLRQEVRQLRNIRVCAVLPPAVDTPIYQKASNVFGHRARSIFPVYAAETIANTIVRTAERPRREMVVGAFGQLVRFGARLAPMLLERLIGRIAPPLQFQEETQPVTEGNAFVPIQPHATEGGWQQYWRDRLGRTDKKRLAKARGT